MAQNESQTYTGRTTYTDRRQEEEKTLLKNISNELYSEGEFFLQPIVEAITELKNHQDEIDAGVLNWAHILQENGSKDYTSGILEKVATELAEAHYMRVARQVRELASSFPLPCHTNKAYKNYIDNYSLKSMTNILGIGQTAEGGYPLLIPKGTFNVITARPGNGKTTALISIANENLLNTKSKGGVFSHIVFISLEEDENEIHKKLVCCRMFRENHFYINANGQTEQRVDGYIEPPKSPLQDFWSYHGKSFNGNESVSEFFHTWYEKADKEVADAIDTGDLKIYDSTNRNISRIKAIMKQYPNSLVLLDYAQLIKPITPTGTIYKDLQDICVDIINAVKTYGNTVIAGAQANRTCDTSDPELIKDTVMREGDDLITCANSAIVLGRNKNGLFWYILKNRNGGGKGTFAHLHTEGLPYSCIWNTREKVTTGERKKGKIEVEALGI